MQSLRPTVDWLLGQPSDAVRCRTRPWLLGERSDSPKVAAERWTHADSLLTTGSTSASSCGRQPPTRDHVLSRVPLDGPYPDDLPVIRARRPRRFGTWFKATPEEKSLSPCECRPNKPLSTTLSTRERSVRRCKIATRSSASLVRKARRLDSRYPPGWPTS